jgi:hypothetical protein
VSIKNRLVDIDCTCGGESPQFGVEKLNQNSDDMVNYFDSSPSSAFFRFLSNHYCNKTTPFSSCGFDRRRFPLFLSETVRNSVLMQCALYLSEALALSISSSSSSLQSSFSSSVKSKGTKREKETEKEKEKHVKQSAQQTQAHAIKKKLTLSFGSLFLLQTAVEAYYGRERLRAAIQDGVGGVGGVEQRGHVDREGNVCGLGGVGRMGLGVGLRKKRK